MGVIADGYGVSCWCDESVLKLIVMLVVQLESIKKKALNLYFQWLN